MTFTTAPAPTAGPRFFVNVTVDAQNFLAASGDHPADVRGILADARTHGLAGGRVRIEDVALGRVIETVLA